MLAATKCSEISEVSVMLAAIKCSEISEQLEMWLLYHRYEISILHSV